MKNIQPKIVFSPEYDFHFYGIERFHPFDGRKFSKAWKEIASIFHEESMWSICPSKPVSKEDLCRIHTKEYLDRLKHPSYVAQALELPALLPLTIFDPQLLEK